MVKHKQTDKQNREGNHKQNHGQNPEQINDLTYGHSHNTIDSHNTRYATAAHALGSFN